MKKFATLLLFLFTISSYSQFTANVAGFHTIPVEDTLTKYTIERYVHYMETNPINYEEDIKKVREVKLIDANRYFVGDFKDGIIILNKRLNDFPNTKRIVILHYLAANNGMKVKNQDNPHVSSTAFNIIDDNEEKFRRQLKYNSPYEYIVEKLKETSPLRSKL